MKLIKLENKKRITIVLSIILLLVLGCFFLLSDTFLSFFHHKKIWVHRVNSIENLEEVKNKFSGVELDVVFIDSLGIFDVGHPPVPSIGLNLKTYIALSNDAKIKYWLDFKNLNKNNVEQSLARLNLICQTLNIDKNQFLIESPEASLLPSFKKSNYDVSYYLPWPGLHQLEKGDLKRVLREVSESVEKYQINTISSNYHDYPLMKKYYPNKMKLLWLTANESEYNSIVKEKLYIHEVLKDTSVVVLLMKYKTKIPER